MERFSETWPKAGTTQNGTAYERPTSVLRINENGFSLLPTPQASDAGVANVQKEIYFLPSGKPRAKSNQGIDGSIGLARWARLWPTPRSADWKGAVTKTESTAKRVHSGEANLCEAVMEEKWPTPQARDWKDGNNPNRHGRHSDSLGVAVRWKTPTAAPWSHGGGGGELQKQVKFRYPTPRAESGVSRKPGTGGRCLQEEARNASQADGGALSPMWVEWLQGFPLGWTEV